jgi:hypothetical protein
MGRLRVVSDAPQPPSGDCRYVRSARSVRNERDFLDGGYIGGSHWQDCGATAFA